MLKSKVIHFYSDCPFFAGCENMLANFLNSEDLHSRYSVFFSYRYSREYENGLKKRIRKNLKVDHVHFPDPCNIFLFDQVPQRWLNKTLNILSRLFLSIPLGVYEVVALYRLFKKTKPQILHINNGGYPGAFSARMAAIAGSLAGVNQIIMVVNNLAIDYKKPTRWIDYPSDFLVKKSVDIFITGSNAAAARLKEVLGLAGTRIDSIKNGIELQQHFETNWHVRNKLGLTNFDGVLLGVVALLIPRKGHIFFFNSILKLISEARLKSSDFVVLIEGDGPQKETLIEFVLQHNLAEVIKFVPHQENIFDFMYALDVLILPSVEDEDFPNVILEAMGLGKPVIASRIAGTAEQVIDGFTGFLVEPNNVNAMACAIESIVKNRDKRLEMGLAGLARFNKNFTASKALIKYLNLFKELL